jgi:hypothetical protein
MTHRRLRAQLTCSLIIGTLAACGAPNEPAVFVGAEWRDDPSLGAVTDVERIDVVVKLRDEADIASVSGVEDARPAQARTAERRSTVQAEAMSAASARVQNLSSLPMFIVRQASRAELTELLAHPDVAAVFEDDVARPTLARSLPLIGQPTAFAQNRRGANQGIAIIDTGVNFGHAAFGACAAAGPTCKVRHAQDFTPTNDGQRDDDGHGTNVAAIALGVAPAAHLVALDVFRRDASGLWASTLDILVAMDWILDNRATYNIKVVNLSLGGSIIHSTSCGGDVTLYGDAVAALLSAGISVVASAGNDARSDGLSSPACVSGVASVGAVWSGEQGGWGFGNCTDNTTAANQIACFSNSASYLQLLAPGAIIEAGGHSLAGTSQAAPHVAGAMAVLAQAFPSETPAQRILRLRRTGTSIRDPRNNVSVPRIALDRAIATTVDVVPPTGTLTIDNGATHTRDGSVGLTIHGADAFGVATMCVTAGGWPCAPFVPYATTRTWSLDTTTNGSKRVNVWLRDAAGNTSNVISDTVVFDNVAPAGSFSIDGAAAYTRDTAVTLNMAATDNTGVTQMCISAGTTCTTWRNYAATAAWTLANTQGSQTVRVWFRDGAGNTAMRNDTITLDSVAPTNPVTNHTTAAGRVNLTWAAATDVTSGIARYVVVGSTGATAPASCTGTPLYSGTGLSFAHTGLTAGTTWRYRICSVDRAGNFSGGSTRGVVVP